jgi:hypothetical protein
MRDLFNLAVVIVVAVVVGNILIALTNHFLIH